MRSLTGLARRLARLELRPAPASGQHDYDLTRLDDDQLDAFERLVLGCAGDVTRLDAAGLAELETFQAICGRGER